MLQIFFFVRVDCKDNENYIIFSPTETYVGVSRRSGLVFLMLILLQVFSIYLMNKWFVRVAENNGSQGIPGLPGGAGPRPGRGAPNWTGPRSRDS